MSIITFLHISDLHYNYKDDDQSDFIKNFLDDIKTMNSSLSCKFVVFSGDLVNSPIKENFVGVKNFFIIPLLKLLDIDQNNFYMVPGNHEIDKNEFETSSIHTQETVLAIKNYVSSYGKKNNEVAIHLNHKFGKFIEFRNSFYNENSNLNEYNSSHIYTFSNNTIGIACINSSLSCFGNSNLERDNIYIGLEQIKVLYAQIKNCDIKIAVFHHPLFVAGSISINQIKNYLYENFHFILTGHTHIESGYAITENDNNIFSSMSSCLYSKDSYKETIYDPCYSIIQIDCDDLIGKAYYRKYYSARKCFDIDLRLFRDGKKSLNVQKASHNLIESIMPSALDYLHKPLINNFTNKLLEQKSEEKDIGYNVDLKDFTIEGQAFDNTDFSRYSLRNTHFKHCIFKKCLFTNCILIDSGFDSCSFVETRFISIDHFYVVKYCDKNSLIAVGGEGGVIVLLNLECNDNQEYSFVKKKFLYGVKGNILSMSWSPCGEYISASDTAGNIYIWNIGYIEPITKVKVGLEDKPIYATEWSPDGKFLTSTDESGHKIYLYTFDKDNKAVPLQNKTTLYAKDQIDHHHKQILYCSWSPNGRLLASVGIDGGVCIWDTSNLNNISFCFQNNIHDNYIRRFIWNESSDGFITCSDDGMVKKWSLNPSKSITNLSKICIKPKEGNNEVLSVLWYKSDVIIAGLRDDDYAIIKNINENNMVVLKTEKAHKGRIWDLSVDRNSDIIFTIGNGNISAWSFDQENYLLNKLCEFESKLLCSGMRLISCSGLSSGEYHVMQNRDIPQTLKIGNLSEFLSTKGAAVH